VTEPVDIAVRANQQLQKEVKELRTRIAAFESSRWWRLHPRFALGRLRPRLSRNHRNADRPKVKKPAEVLLKPSDEVTARFRDEVVARGSFSQDWFSVHIAAWDTVLDELNGRRSRILELGSFEGLSTCFLLWRLPDAHVTCVDTFAGIPEYSAYGIDGSRLEQAFDRNVALVDASRVRKLVGETRRVLPDLVDEGKQFDLVYVDASHRALDVMVDAALSWQLLTPGGIAIFDDYGSIPLGLDPMLHPTPAIDAFLELVAGHFEIVDQRRQLMVRKTG
jgi:hypothetical protein